MAIADTIMHAAGVGDFELLVRLVEAGADVNEREGGSTALMIAVEEDYARDVFVKYLLDHGADPNIPNVYGDYPLDIARYNKDKDAIELLEAHGAEENGGPSNKEQAERSVHEGFGAIMTFMEVEERKVIAQRVELEQKEPPDPRPWYEVLESDGNWYRTIIRPGDIKRLRQEGKKFRSRSKVNEIREAVANPSIANPPLTILPLELDIIEKIKCSGWYEVDLKGDGVWYRITRHDARIFFEIGDKVRFRNADEVLVLFPFDPRRKRSLPQ